MEYWALACTEAAHNKAQARIDRIQIPAPKLYIESEFTDDEGREGGEFLALLWQRDLFHSARAMRGRVRRYIRPSAADCGECREVAGAGATVVRPRKELIYVFAGR